MYKRVSVCVVSVVLVFGSLPAGRPTKHATCNSSSLKGEKPSPKRNSKPQANGNIKAQLTSGTEKAIRSPFQRPKVSSKQFKRVKVDVMTAKTSTDRVLN